MLACVGCGLCVCAPAASCCCYCNCLHDKLFERNDLPLRGRLLKASRSRAQRALHTHSLLSTIKALEALGYCILQPETGQSAVVWVVCEAVAMSDPDISSR
jgi:hypothetical protein